jgi:hypothetical protein
MWIQYNIYNLFSSSLEGLRKITRQAVVKVGTKIKRLMGPMQSSVKYRASKYFPIIKRTPKICVTKLQSRNVHIIS